MNLSGFVTYHRPVSGWGIRLAVLVVAGVLGLLCAGSPAFAASSSARAASAKPANPEGPDQLLQTASLKVFDAEGAVSFGPLAVSGSTVVATGGDYGDRGSQYPDTLGGDPAAYVFTEPSGQWHSETGAAAVLEPSHGEDMYSIATSGDLVAAGATGAGSQNCCASHPGAENPYGTGPPAVYVFTEPAGGWSGLLHESATLKATPGASDPNIGGSVAVSSNTVLATAFPSGSPGDSGVVDVFSEPAGGWSGTVYPSATLVDSSGAELGSVRADGSTITADTESQSGPNGADVNPDGVVDVFVEPPGGWSGTIDESARIKTFTPYGVSGKTVLTSVNSPSAEGVTNEPAYGWSGTVAPSATLTGLPYAQIYDGGPLSGAISDSTAAILNGTSDKGQFPCFAVVSEFNKPAGGWHGSLGPSARTSTGDGNSTPSSLNIVEANSIGISGQAILVGAEGAIRIYTKAAATRRPSASQTSVTGLAKRKPQLTLQLTAGQKSQSLQAFTIVLPAGLHFNKKTLAGHLRLAGRPRYKLTDSSHAVTVTLRGAVRSMAVTISAPGLGADKTLLRAAKRLAGESRARRHKHRISLKVTASVIDAAGAPSSLTLHPNAT